jgi:hypothetical protein
MDENFADAVVECAVAVPPVPPVAAIEPPPPPGYWHALFVRPSADEVVVQPLSVRYQPARMRNRRLMEFWRETPCWLTSLVIHLTVVLILGLMLTPDRNSRYHPIRLIASLAIADDAESSAEVTIVTDARSPADESTDRRRADGLGETGAGEKSLDSDEPPPAKHEESLPWTREEAAGAGGDEWVRASLDIAQATLTRLSAGADAARAEANPEHAEIVEEFIQYDIGRLRGEAGQRAQRRFHALGPEAIPALVRGLNRSAGISASCPVGVLSYKLVDALSRSNDPADMDYVVENIGRDVPPGAPHQQRIMNLRDNLQELVARQRGLRADEIAVQEKRIARWRETLAARGYSSSDEQIRRVDALLRQGRAAVAAAADSDDVNLRRTAMLAAAVTTQALGERTTAEELAVARAAVDRLTDPDIEVRRMAHDAAGRFLGDAPLGVAPDDPAADREAQRKALHARLDRESQELVVGRQARTQLRLADQLRKAGRTDRAIDRYENIARSFPGTAAARAARERIAEVKRERVGGLGADSEYLSIE